MAARAKYTLTSSDYQNQMAVIHSLPHDNSVWCCSFAGNGSFLATCAGDDMLRMWNTETGAQTAAMTIPMVKACDISSDSRLLAVCCRRPNVLVYGTEDLMVRGSVLFNSIKREHFSN